ncbi:MAG TPA: O-antigen ligase family protein [Candidatus Acidoferrum sp.]|jgi:O-antigen ligase|nr:O-antigen ligase family protein [Candidatus Acidoferrum sp.]
MDSYLTLGLIILLGAPLAIAGLFRPFLGMLVFMVIHFVQPGELIPALEPFRIELMYGTLLIGVLIYRRAFRSGPALLSDPIIAGSFVLLSAAILSVPLAVWLGGAANSVLALVKLIALVVLLSLLVDSQPRLRMILWCITVIAAWIAGSSLWSYAGGQYYELEYDLGSLSRAQGVNSIVGGPNELAGLLLALLPLTVVLFRCTRSILARLLLLACGTASLIALLLTGSRIAVIGLAAIGIYYTLQSKRKVLSFVACGVISCLVWVALPNAYRQRYLTVESYATGGQLDASNELRLEVWKAGEKIFFHNPIVGVGAGQFPTAYGLIYLHGEHKAWMNPHNLLIQIACELGIVGFAAFGYFFVQIVKGLQFVLRRRAPETELNYQTAIACSVMCVGILFLSLVGHTLYRPYWYLLAGLVAANRNILCSTPNTFTESPGAAREAAPTVATRFRRPLGIASQVAQRTRTRGTFGKGKLVGGH